MTFQEACKKFFAWLEGCVKRQDVAARTLGYYREQLEPLIEQFGDQDLAKIDPFALESWLPSWHRWQAARRLITWVMDHGGKIEESPLKGIHRDAPDRRDRIASRLEMARILRASPPRLREILIFVRHSLVRPGEARELRWSERTSGGFEKVKYKAKHRRKAERARRVRTINPTARAMRLIERLARRIDDKARREREGVLPFMLPAARAPQAPATDFVFLNSRGRPWTKDMLALGIRRVRQKLGLEDVVAYTLRHTGATAAAGHDVNLALLAEYLGHSNVATTQRYIHASKRDLDHVASLIGDKPPRGEREILKFPAEKRRAMNQ